MDMHTAVNAHGIKPGNNKDFFECILEAIPEGIWITDAADTIYYTNKAMEQIAGVPREQIVNKSIVTDFPSETITEFIKHYTFAKEHLQQHWYEAKVVNPAGKNTYQNGWLIPLIEEERFAGMICTIRDVTEATEARMALSQSELLLRKIFEILPIGLWIADASGKLVSGNLAGIQIWGAEPHVAIEDYGVFKARRLPSGEEIAPDDWALAHTIREGITVENELLEIDAFDGVQRIILNFTAPVKDEQNRLQGAIIVNQDITELKKQEAALKASEKRFRDMLDKIPEAVFLQDGTDGKILFANAFAIKQYGYTQAEFSHLNPNHLDADTGIYVQERLSELAYKKQLVFETEHKTKFGFVFPVEVHSHYYEESNAFTLLSLCRDITARKKAERAELRYKDQLENEVARRTAQLQGKNRELQKLNDLFIGRESRIKELREKIKQLDDMLSQQKEQ